MRLTVVTLILFVICVIGGPLLTNAQNTDYLDLETPDFKLRLVKASQTVAALEPKSAPGFDFTPADRLSQRAANGYHHLGDLILRLRVGIHGPWQKYDTAESRAPVAPLKTNASTLAAADLTPPPNIPLEITRSWIVDNGRLVLRFELRNKTSQPVSIGALGIPMVFNNMITGRNLKEAHEKCSFSDPYIGQDAGYLQVTRLSGAGPALVVVPDGETPFEAYQLLDEPTRPSQTFEGAFAWMIHTHAFAEDEWRGAVPWNPPTWELLPPGATRTYGVKFLLADGIRNIETTLAQNNRPVAIGIPGYVLPMDVEGRLFVNHKRKVTAIAVHPAGALEVNKQYFGYDDKALVSLNSIIGYMPTLPHWGYNGNARRYWDFLYGGKIRRIERQLHHYGSGLNAIPVLAHYREHPDDEYLLRVGYGGTMGALSNIDQEGFASAAFHSFPSTLKWDPYSGDYGPNFFGHALNIATYVINHPEFGWQSFGGNISVSGHWINVQPLDSFRKRVYVAPLGLWLTLDAGTFERIAINSRSNLVRVTLSRADSFTPNARLRVQQPASITSVETYAPRGNFVNERDAFTIPLRRSTRMIDLGPQKGTKDAKGTKHQ